MSVSMTTRRLIVSFFLTVLLPLPLSPISLAHAQVQAGEQDPAYREHIRLALAAYEADQLETAKAQFLLAHARYPNARTLRGLGTVELELGELVPAVEHLTAALAASELSLSDALRGETETALREASAQLGHVRVFVTPAQAEVLLDGQPRRTGVWLALLPGTHQLVLSAAGYVSQQRELAVQSNEHQLVQLVLERRSEQATAAQPPKTKPVARPASEAEAWKPWLVTASGGVLLVAGAVLLGSGLHDRAKSSDPDAGKTTYQEWQDAGDRYPKRTAAGGVLIGLGTAGIATGLVWRARQQRGSELRVSLGVSGVLVHGRF
jgi:hypothetical protein